MEFKWALFIVSQQRIQGTLWTRREHLYPNYLDKELQDRWYPQKVHLTTYKSANFGMKFILRGRVGNIPGCETRNREVSRSVHCNHAYKIWGIFTLLNKNCQSDWSFTWVDGIEVAHQLKRDKLQYDLCSKSYFG
jgi:hypothetical protein